MARKSVEIDDTDDWSHWALGVVHLYRREYGQAEIACRRAIEINPNYADLLAHTGLFLTFAGKPEEAIAQTSLPKDLFQWRCETPGGQQADHGHQAFAALCGIRRTQPNAQYRGRWLG